MKKNYFRGLPELEGGAKRGGVCVSRIRKQMQTLETKKTR